MNILASVWYWIKSSKIQKQLSSSTTSISWISVYVNSCAVQKNPYYTNKKREPNHMKKRIKRTEIAKKELFQITIKETLNGESSR